MSKFVPPTTVKKTRRLPVTTAQTEARVKKKLPFLLEDNVSSSIELPQHHPPQRVQKTNFTGNVASRERMLFANLQLLGFPFDDLMQKHHLELKKELFRKPSWKTFELVFAFFYEKWDQKQAETDFKEFALLTGKKRESEFRKIIIKWYKELQEKNPGSLLLPSLNNTTWIQPSGEQFLGYVLKLSTFLLLHQTQSEGVDVLGPPVETKNGVAVSLSRRAYYDLASDKCYQFRTLEESREMDKNAAESIAQSLASRIRDAKRQISLKKEELKEAVGLADVSEDVKDRLCDLEDGDGFEDLKKSLDELQKDYNTYFRKIERYALLTRECLDAGLEIERLSREPPVVDFSKIAALVAVDKASPSTNMAEILCSIRLKVVKQCEELRQLPDLPDMQTSAKLEKFMDLRAKLEHMSSWLSDKISNQNRILDSFRSQRHPRAKGFLSLANLQNLNTFNWSSKDVNSAVFQVPRQVKIETAEEILERYEAIAKKRRNNKIPTETPVPSKSWLQGLEEPSTPSHAPTHVPDHYFTISKQREFQIHKAASNQPEEPWVFKARPVPSSTYRPPMVNMSLLETSTMSSKRVAVSRFDSRDMTDSQLSFSSTGSKNETSEILRAADSEESRSYTESEITTALSNVKCNLDRDEDWRQSSRGPLEASVRGFGAKEFDVEGICNKKLNGNRYNAEENGNTRQPVPFAVPSFTSLSLNLSESVSTESVDEVDSPCTVKDILDDLSISQVEIDDELSRMFGDAVIGSEPHEPSLINDSLINLSNDSLISSNSNESGFLS